MLVDVNNLVSITEANQNFSKVIRLVDEKGTAVILKNNVPRYVLLDISLLEKEKEADNETVEEVAKKTVDKYIEAFKELAKWKR